MVNFASAAGLISSSVTIERTPLDCRLGPREVLRLMRDQRWPFALVGEWAGGGAIIGSEPLIVADPGCDPFALLDALPQVKWAPEPDGADHPAAVGVCGGWFGWLGYRLGGLVEDLPPGPPRPVPVPEFHLAYYDHLLRLDGSGRWWFEALVTPARANALAQRQADLRALLSVTPSPAWPEPYIPPDPFRLGGAGARAHLAAVRRCRRRIVAGEIFQANICLRLESEWEGRLAELFDRALERIHPRYGALFETPWTGIASFSPELFLRRRGELVITEPIKGTISRGDDRAMAEAALRALRRSAKDAAEHVMIVDLMRNDLGRVCAYGSIEAPRTPEAQPHPGLWHLVSSVRGRLRPQTANRDLLRATFPPGSVTGAPKIQAMRVIAELESSSREVYTGAIGFASPVAGLELSVAIRTLESSRGHLWLGAGGGIVADSDPDRELREALLKARPILRAVGSDTVQIHA